MMPPAYTVEIQFGSFFGLPSWYDVTPFVEWQEGFSVTRGRPNEQSDPTPGKFACVLNNSDGRFTPGFAASPYYPNVQDGAPCRVSVIRPSTVNLEDNASHELGIAEWQGAGPGTAPTLTQSTTHVYPGDEGLLAMLVTWVAQATGSGAQRRIYGLTVGQQYTVSRYVYVPTGSPDVQLAVGDGVSATGSPVSTKDAFARATVTFVATSTSHNLQLQVTSSVSGGQCWTDGGQVETGASATTLAASALKIPRYYGFLSQAPARWNILGTYLVTDWTALDVTERISSRTGNLRSFVIEEALLDKPLVLLPLDEASGATQAGNLGSVGGAGQLVKLGNDPADTFTFAGATGPPADGSSSFLFTVPDRTFGPHGWTIVCPAGLVAATQFSVECWFNSTVGGSILALANITTAKTTNPACLLTTIGGGRLDWLPSENFVSEVPTNVLDGKTHHVVGTYIQDGTHHTTQLYFDGQLVDTDSISSSDVSGKSAVYLVLAAGGGTFFNWSGALNHVAVYPTVLSAARVAAHYAAGWTGFGGETSDQRISRIAAYSGLTSLTPANRTGVGVWDDPALGLWDSMIWAGSDLNLESGYATVYGQSGGGSDYMTEMRKVAATEGGLVLANPDGTLAFQNRRHRYNAQPAAAIPAEYATTDLVPTYDNQYTINDLTAATQDGAVSRFNDPTSIAQRGTYDPGQLDLLTRDQADAYAAASANVNRYSIPRLRYRQVTLDLATMPDDLVTAVLQIDVGDRFDLTGLPTNVPAATAPLMVEGYTESSTQDTWTITFNCSDAGAWAAGVWDSPAYGTWDQSFIWAW